MAAVMNWIGIYCRAARRATPPAGPRQSGQLHSMSAQGLNSLIWLKLGRYAYFMPLQDYRKSWFDLLSISKLAGSWITLAYIYFIRRNFIIILFFYIIGDIYLFDHRIPSF